MIESIKYGDAASVLAADLTERILSGELKAGSTTKIRLLAEEFGMSISPVKDALRILAGHGLIIERSGRSPMVASPNLKTAAESNEIRLAIEPIVLADSVSRHNQESLRAAEALLEKTANAQSPVDRVRYNREFHFALISESSKMAALQIVKAQYGILALRAHVVAFHQNTTADVWECASEESQHRLILNSLKQSDADTAVFALEEHIRATQRRIQKGLQQVNADNVNTEML
jgi:DNA-binding GntR family transcriptional regulator